MRTFIFACCFISFTTYAQTSLFQFELGKKLDPMVENHKAVMKKEKQYDDGEKYLIFSTHFMKANDDDFDFRFELTVTDETLNIYGIEYEFLFPKQKDVLDVFSWLKKTFGTPTSTPVQFYSVEPQPLKKGAELQKIQLAPQPTYYMSWGCKLKVDHSPVFGSTWVRPEKEKCIFAYIHPSLRYIDGRYEVRLSLWDRSIAQ